ncbi:MAG: 2-amino-4-hydroxy-6-hydroxymethyldihydropteridine diphosphokinase [Pseudomonadota bacterium]|nr:2-amino-4-hydroxy-6-hydroxymethyldihydropteridine diphosphokinase [Pseudomonadota bacterium]
MRTDLAPQRVAAYIGIGSNLGNPEFQVRRALAVLEHLDACRLTAVSPLYRTSPVGPQDQPDYVNAVARLRTGLTPRALLAALQDIELAQDRCRDGTRWGPRTLDLDILLYGDERIESPGLQIPHPQLANRAFVLVPLTDVAPDGLRVTGHGSLKDMLERCPRGGIVLLGPESGVGSGTDGKRAESGLPYGDSSTKSLCPPRP